MTIARMPAALLAATALGLLTACQAPLPGQTTENTQTGAVVGAGLGLLLGAATGDNREERIENAAIGALIGGGLGAAVGNDLDRQEAELRQQLGRNVGIVNDGNQLVVTLPQDILFAVDSAQLTGSLQSDLLAVAGSLNRYPNTLVNVIGHTDSDGDAGYNQRLSEQRAQAVAGVLVSGGVSPGRISAVGRGENSPVATNLTPEGKAQNRRVEIIIIPIQ
jgi:outer membrane protein OmpA-like peptidoglycan-associated protein